MNRKNINKVPKFITLKTEYIYIVVFALMYSYNYFKTTARKI